MIHKQGMDENDLYLAVGKAIAVRRDELNLTQQTLAERVGLSRASLANIETGRQKILLHYLYRIAAALRVSRIEELLPTNVQPTEFSKPEDLAIGGDTLNEKQKAEVEAFFAKSTPKRRPGRNKQ